MASVNFDRNAIDPPPPPLRPEESNISTPTNRQRWATHRATKAGGMRKRVSIMDRFHKRSEMRDEKRKSTAGNSTTTTEPSPVASPEDENRKVYVNIPLPESERDEDGHPKANYPRNKVRTAKYTPVTFVPKNLWFQFQNIANIYFLFIIILGFFSIFGVDNPGMNTVPLIVIIVVTAIKDAIEDWRRTVLDTELNNSPVYRLVEWNNVNSTDDNVSLWRRFKKSCTRATIWTYRHLRNLFQKNKKNAEPADTERRASYLTTVSPRASMDSQHGDRGQDEAIQMTPVPSPVPDARSDWPLSTSESSQYLHPDKAARNSKPPSETSSLSPKKGGSVVDPTKQATGNARFKRDYWKSLQVGDFVRLYNGDPIPADIVVMSTSDPDGACYVETKSLDGETNLKVRHALHCGRKVRHARDCEKSEFIVESEAPHANLYAYNGAVRWDQRDPDYPDAPRTEMVEPITINNLLLRGCSLRNTEWILGVVVFTGV